MQPPRHPALIGTRWFRGSVLAAGALVVALLWSVVCTAPAVPWNPPRLAPAVALAHGLPIYSTRDSGAQLGWCYGPVMPLWYLPVAWLENPTAILVLASVWNALTLFAPLAWVLRIGGLRGWPLWSMLVLGGTLVLACQATRYDLVFVHVDTLCLAFGLLACAALDQAARKERPGWEIHAVVVSLTLAIWTKQLAVALGPALLGWACWPGRRRLLRPLLYWGLVYGGLISLGVFLCFGTEKVLFNTWLVQARNPWRGGPELLGKEMAGLLISLWAWLPLAVWSGGARRGPAAECPDGRLVALLLWAALWQLPLGLVATLKVGGGTNSLHSLYYVLVAGLIVAGRRLQSASGRWPTMATWGVMVALPLASAVQLTRSSGAAWWPDRTQDGLLIAVRQARGRLYLPWNPLITVLTDNRVYPFDNALYCLWLDGLEPPPERIRAAVPHDAVLLYVEPAPSHFALRYFPHPANESTNTRPLRK